jgi:ATP-dependent DNA helicase RecQ
MPEASGPLSPRSHPYVSTTLPQSPAGAALSSDALEGLRTLVRETWGFHHLRPDQVVAIQATLEQRDALVVMPTGGGKSLCYQAPALIREGLTVVVSPLISLMKDQIDGLHANGVPAGMLSSNQGAAERREVYGALETGGLSLLFVSPERLALPGFARRLDEANWHTLAVDEAHCISHWGHNFRPEYRQLGDLRRSRPHLCVQAYTATATPRVREDIVAQLGLRDPTLVVGNFDRPNLTYRVFPRNNLTDQIHEVIQRHTGEAGIVYCLRRKDVDQITQKLKQRGVKCEGYHAGLTPSKRRKVQEAFRTERLDIVVATVAFGMGIDRSDVRFVVHASLPKGVEQYSQETGRAGRDGLPSECVLIFSGADYQGWKRLIEHSANEARDAGVPDADRLREGGERRLGDMWSLAANVVCRHQRLVEYFGQSLEKQDCGACDVCLGELEIVPDALVIAQKILSCVARCDQRYGAGHVTDVLRGANTERVRSLGHEHLSTHGLLKAHTRPVIRSWVDQLVALEYLGSTGGRYPTVHLTQRSRSVLKGEEEPKLFRPRVKVKATKRAAEVEGADPQLYEHLRTLRRRLAHERSVPPYTICSNATLAAIAAHRPRTRAELLEIKGIGHKKADTFGQLMIAAIADFESAA